MWKNRIIQYGVKPADQFKVNERNWRRHPQHQQTMMRQVLDQLGWVGVVIENVQTGNLVDGHERVWEALDKNEEVPYLLVSLTEEEEALALATFDTIGHAAQTDEAVYAALLKDLQAATPDLSALVTALATEMQVSLEGVEPASGPRHTYQVFIECPHCGHKFPK